MAEVDRVCGKKQQLTGNDLSNLQFMGMCMKEVIRLYPSAPAIVRDINKPCTLDGYSIPENTLVLVRSTYMKMSTSSTCLGFLVCMDRSKSNLETNQLVNHYLHVLLLTLFYISAENLIFYLIIVAFIADRFYCL